MTEMAKVWRWLWRPFSPSPPLSPGSPFTGKGALLPSAQGDVDKAGRWTTDVQANLEQRLTEMTRTARNGNGGGSGSHG